MKPTEEESAIEQEMNQWAMNLLLEIILNNPCFVLREYFWDSMGKSVADDAIEAAKARDFVTIKKAGCPCHDKIELTDAGIAFLIFAPG